jgi:hypothetical protein
VRSGVLSAVVFGALIGFLAVLTVLRPHPPPSAARATARPAAPAPALVPSEPAPPLPPDQTRSASLFDRNRSMPADPDLASEYEDLNVEYFANILPAPEVRWESGLADLGPLIAEGFSVQGLTDGRMILINPVVAHDPDQRRRALCHEMVHMAVWAQDMEHGPIFQERLRELSLRGAFKGIVATDQEKDATLAALQRERGDIDSEERALMGERASLDRTSQAAVDAYNARLRRHQSEIAEYNRLVGQYNLMISYPDGLARERLAARADGTVPGR